MTIIYTDGPSKLVLEGGRVVTRGEPIEVSTELGESLTEGKGRRFSKYTKPAGGGSKKRGSK